MASSFTIEDVQKFYSDSPLYKEIEASDFYDEFASSVIDYKGSLDLHCPECGKHSVFTFAGRNEANYEATTVFFRCSRDPFHTAYFVIRQADQKLQKVGQYPSFATLQLPETKKYSKLLGKDYSAEFNKAIGLATHGVGVGSFVYLRRVFESLIEEAHQLAIGDAGWSEDEYKDARMSERIGLLSHHLPEFLVDHKNLYGILSKGVHELSEQECLDSFDTVKLGIETILDEKLFEQERESKRQRASSSMNKLNAKLKDSDA